MWNDKLKKAVTKAIRDIANEVPKTERYTKKDHKKLEKHCILDPAKIMHIEAKSKEAKAILYDFMSKDEMEYTPDLEYHVQSEFVECKYSGTYMLLAVNLLEASSEYEGSSDRIIISVKKEYPITLENEHFKIIIAPIIDD